MGEVYKARDARLERDVATKALPERLAADKEALERFEGEAKAGGAGAKGTGISPEAQSLLLEYAWPGNVRELRNVMERAAILCPQGSDVLPFHLPFLGQPSLSRVIRGPGAAGRSASAEAPPSISEASTEAERDALVRALQHFGGRLDATARGLGVSRATLYRKLKKHGIAVPRNSIDES